MNYKYLSIKGLVAVIDIGQGDSIFIQTPFHSENILIDTGGKIEMDKPKWATKEKNKANAENSLIPFLKSRGVKKLDKVFITHGHQDHFGDLSILNSKIPIKEVYYPEGTDQKKGFKKALKTIKKTGTMCYSVLANTSVITETNLEILAPEFAGTGENDDSLVLCSRIGGKKFLFTGDLEKEGEQKLITRLPELTINILKVGHHGSKTSSSPDFIKAIQPTEGIISCSRSNRFGHPNQETITTFKQNKVIIYQTKEDGVIYYEWTPFTPLSKAKTLVNSKR